MEASDQLHLDSATAGRDFNYLQPPLNRQDLLADQHNAAPSMSHKFNQISPAVKQKSRANKKQQALAAAVESGGQNESHSNAHRLKPG